MCKSTLTINSCMNFLTEEVACADPEKCREICNNPNGCTNIAYPFLVMRILPDGKLIANI